MNSFAFGRPLPVSLACWGESMPDLTAQTEEKKKRKGTALLAVMGENCSSCLDKKICPWDAIKMYEFDDGVERSKYFYEPAALDAVKGVYVTNAVEKRRLEEKQLELYDSDQ
jgi:hypothetical protein